MIQINYQANKKEQNIQRINKVINTQINTKLINNN